MPTVYIEIEIKALVLLTPGGIAKKKLCFSNSKSLRVRRNGIRISLSSGTATRTDRWKAAAPRSSQWKHSLPIFPEIPERLETLKGIFDDASSWELTYECLIWFENHLWKTIIAGILNGKKDKRIH